MRDAEHIKMYDRIAYMLLVMGTLTLAIGVAVPFDERYVSAYRLAISMMPGLAAYAHGEFGSHTRLGMLWAFLLSVAALGCSLNLGSFDPEADTMKLMFNYITVPYVAFIWIVSASPSDHD